MRKLITGVAFVAVALATGVVAAGPAAAADRDCTDFPSQKAAQIFFLNQGGPNTAPHRLDADGDGVACDTRPAPYYYGTKLPGGNGGGGGKNGTGKGTRVYVVDGDTFRLRNGSYVRLIGIDTPEKGKRGHQAAKMHLRKLISHGLKLQNPKSVKDRDRYGRLLRYVKAPRRGDAGLSLVKAGLARPRYDSTDGYQRHPKQPAYYRAYGKVRNPVI